MTTSLGSSLTLLENAGTYLRHRIADISLMHGWLPPTVEAAAMVLLVCAFGWHARSWWLLRLPLFVGPGVAL
ncbi:MAG: hypothetical protein JWR13_1553, partial [Mycobacterium sp.]|nr:hypothetical protein [Mycobacterium sp.]